MVWAGSTRTIGNDCCQEAPAYPHDDKRMKNRNRCASQKKTPCHRPPPPWTTLVGIQIFYPWPRQSWGMDAKAFRCIAYLARCDPEHAYPVEYHYSSRGCGPGQFTDTIEEVSPNPASHFNSWMARLLSAFGRFILRIIGSHPSNYGPLEYPFYRNSFEHVEAIIHKLRYIELPSLTKIDYVSPSYPLDPQNPTLEQLLSMIPLTQLKVLRLKFRSGSLPMPISSHTLTSLSLAGYDHAWELERDSIHFPPSRNALTPDQLRGAVHGFNRSTETRILRVLHKLDAARPI